MENVIICVNAIAVHYFSLRHKCVGCKIPECLRGAFERIFVSPRAREPQTPHQG